MPLWRGNVCCRPQRCTEIACAFSLSLSLSLSPSLLLPRSFLSFPRLCSRSLPLLPGFAPFSEVRFRAYESRNPADRCTCQKRPRDRPSEMSNVQKRATRREAFTWFTPDDPNCAPPRNRGRSAIGRDERWNWLFSRCPGACPVACKRPPWKIPASREEFLLLLVSTMESNFCERWERFRTDFPCYARNS